MRKKVLIMYMLVIALIVSIMGCNPFQTEDIRNLPARIETVFPVSTVPGVKGTPVMAWAGDRWGVIYCARSDNVNMDTLYFCSIRINNREMSFSVTNEKLIGSAAILQSPDIVWTGTEFGVVWSGYNSDIYDIWFCLLDKEGSFLLAPYTPDAASNDNSHSPALVWNDDTGEYAVVWQEMSGSSIDTDIRYVIMDNEGNNKTGPGSLVQGTGSTSRNPDIVWTGTEYTFAWEDNIVVEDVNESGTVPHNRAGTTGKDL